MTSNNVAFKIVGWGEDLILKLHIILFISKILEVEKCF